MTEVGRLKWVDVRGSLLLAADAPMDEVGVSPLTRLGMLVPPGMPSLLRGRYGKHPARGPSRRQTALASTPPRCTAAADKEGRWPEWACVGVGGIETLECIPGGV